MMSTASISDLLERVFLNIVNVERDIRGSFHVPLFAAKYYGFHCKACCIRSKPLGKTSGESSETGSSTTMLSMDGSERGGFRNIRQMISNSETNIHWTEILPGFARGANP